MTRAFLRFAPALLGAALLTGCGAAENGLLSGGSVRPYAVTAHAPSVLEAQTPRFYGALPASFAAPAHLPPRRANAEMARDLTDLTFRNEAGETRSTLARWEGPARVRLAEAFAEEGPFLDSLLAELSDLTGLELRRAGALEPAEIRIRAVRPARFASEAPGVLCGSQHSADWSRAASFRGGIVDIPADSSPARRRICLIEELAQLLGPVNDLERIPDTIFNDDGAHAALTGFDRLMLRTLYAPELKPGMSPAEAQAAAATAMARLNPAGLHGASLSAPESAEWSSAYRAALGAFGRDFGGFDQAMRRLDSAAAALPHGDHRRVKTLTTKAAAALAQGDAAAAARKAEEARALARSSGDEAREAEALGLMARAAGALGDSAGAARWSAEAKGFAARLQRWDLEESLAAPPPSGEIRAAKAR